MQRALTPVLLLSLSLGPSACAFPYTATTPILPLGARVGDVSPWLMSLGYRPVPRGAYPYGSYVTTYVRATNHHEDQLDIMTGSYGVGCNSGDYAMCYRYYYAVVEARTFAIEDGRRRRVGESETAREHARTITARLTQAGR